MSEKTENQSNALDMFKWVVVFALLAGLVTANTMYGEISVLYRAIAIVVVVGIAGFIAATTDKGSTFLSFAKESRTEVRKVVWPTQEANQTTLIVLAATLIMALILWGLDGIIVRVVGFITGIGA